MNEANTWLHNGTKSMPDGVAVSEVVVVIKCISKTFFSAISVTDVVRNVKISRTKVVERLFVWADALNNGTVWADALKVKVHHVMEKFARVFVSMVCEFVLLYAALIEGQGYNDVPKSHHQGYNDVPKVMGVRSNDSTPT